MTSRIFVDANIFLSRTLMDWLFLLRAETGRMFSLVTSEDVLAEVGYSLRRMRPDAPGRLVVDRRARIVEFIDEVLTDFDGTVPYPGSDPDDRHVHAATLGSGADILLTNDSGLQTSDDALYEVYRADDFFVLIDDGAPVQVMRVTHAQRAYWQSRKGKPLAAALRDASCPTFAERVQGHLRTLAGVRRADSDADRRADK